MEISPRVTPTLGTSNIEHRRSCGAARSEFWIRWYCPKTAS